MTLLRSLGRSAVAVLALAAAVSAPAHASTAAATIAAAIDAHGGMAALERWANVSYEGELTAYFGAREVTGSSKTVVRDGRWLMQEWRLVYSGTTYVIEQASTGGSAWRRSRGRVYDFPPDNANAWLAHRPDILLRAAVAAPAELELLGTVDLDGDPALAVEFREADGATRILLDEATHRVRALEFKMMRNDGDGNPEETFVKKTYADYRDVDGIPFPHRFEEFADGARRSTIVLTSLELGHTPDAVLFAKPEADEESRDWGDQIAN